METAFALGTITLGLVLLYWSYLHGAERHPGRVANHAYGKVGREGRTLIQWAMAHPEVIRTRSGMRYAVQKAVRYAEKSEMNFA